MRISSELTDSAVLLELGQRLERRRINSGLTQAELAEQAGISKRSVERIEGGSSTDFVILLRAMRALKLLDTLEQAVPEVPQSPLLLLKSKGRARKRVGHSRRKPDEAQSRQASPWKWQE